MTKSKNALADTAARLVEAINLLHERIELAEDAIIAIDDRTRPHASKSMAKPRLRHTPVGWQPRALESAGDAMKRLGVTRVRQDASGEWQAA
jgi:hypothetical protein